MFLRAQKSLLIKLSFLLIFVFSFSLAKGARIYFNDIYKGTGSNYAEQTNSLSNIQFITGTGFTFTSTDPSDLTFRLTGNNVGGTLSYVDANGIKQSIVGQVSRQDKDQGNTKGLYFFTNTNEAYLLVLPGVTTYTAGSNVGTSSDNQFLSAMNTILSSQNSQPKISVNDVTVNNTDPYAVFTVSLSSAANANSTFTPSLTAVTATLNTDYTGSMQYYNGTSWVNITTTVTIAQGATSIQIRVPILNAGAASNRTFNLNTGTVTGSNVLNSDGAYGIGTILPTPTITTTGTLKTFTSCSGCTVNPQSFTVSGNNLTANIVLTAPTGINISTNSSSGFATTVTLTQVSNAVTTTTIYAKLANNATTASSGTISITSTNATSKTITCTVNTDNALNFDGVNDHVDLGDVLDITSLPYTKEAWVYWKGSSNAFSEIITKDVVQAFAITSDNKLHANFGNGSTWGSGVNSTATIPLNKWTHVAVTRDASGIVKLYINGILDASSATLNYNGSTSGVTLIGGKRWSNNTNYENFFNGAIDNIKVWNVEKTVSEIATSMYTEQTGSESGLIAYYNFNQGIAGGSNSGQTSLTDQSSSGFNGTLTNFDLTTSTNYITGFAMPIKTNVNANVNNNALSFDGTNDYVISNVSGASASSFTIEAFVNPANTSGTKGILQWASGSTTAGNPMVLFQQDGTNLRVYVNSGYNLITSLSANTWSHIALVYSNSLYTLYVNGTSVATYSGPTTFQANATQFYLGTGYPTTWGGLIDEVRIWNTARSTSEINKNMYNDLLGNESGLMAYYNFNQGNANGTNTGSLTDKTSNANNGTFMNFALTGSSSNFVPGNAQIGSSATFSVGTTYQLANSLSGGTWSSNNTAVATVNSSTGVVTGVATGSASITYSICNKSVSYPVDIYTPTITVNNALKTFTSCSGCSITPQSFTVSANDLTTNVTVTAPTGFELSSSSGGTYSSTLYLMPSGGGLSSAPVYVRLTNSATTATSGNITLSSNGAASKTVTATVNTDNALSLDGVNDYVSIPDYNALDLTSNSITSFTIEAWVNTFSNTSSQVIVGKIDSTDGNSSGMAYALRYNNGSLVAEIGNGTNATNISFANALVLNKWQHVAMVFNGANVGGQIGNLQLYIDGVLKASSTTGYSLLKNSTSSLRIGAYSTTYGQYFKGSIDNLKIWNVAKTSSEITSGMNTELSGTETGLVAYYNFNHGIAAGTNSSISLIEDRTSNGFSGTLLNFAKTGTSSNFINGFIPTITAAGNATSVVQNNTLQLSNGLTGGSWSSSNTSLAVVDASTGLVTGVSAGSVTINYTICNKTVSYNLSVVAPTLTTSSLKTFTSCSGCTIDPQKFTVSGSNLSANVLVSAPTGFVMSTTATGTYVTSLTFTPTAGTLNSTDVYAKLQNSASSGTSGNFTVASTGAVSKTVTATVNTDNALNFDGGDAINIGQPITTGASYTMEAWVKYQPPVGNSTSSNIISSYNNPFFIQPDNKLYAGLNSNYVLVSSPSTIEINKWVHVAVTFDDVANTMKLFVNGVEVSSNSNVTTSFTLSGSEPLFIGSHSSQSPFNPTSFFKGNIDEVRIWNTVKTATEIQDNMYKELTGTETNLSAYYNFNQGVIGGSNSGLTTLYGRTTPAFNGTMTGFALTGNTSNYVAGFMPEITGASSLQKSSTATYTNNLTGGTWSSAATGVATVDASGVITGVSAGTSTITYTICDKTVSKVITIVEPTITTSGTLTAFTACEGNVSASQSFTITASNLTANLVLTAPTGYELSLASGGTYSSTLSITPISGSVSSRAVYVRLTSTAVNGVGGNIAATSTGATTKNVATGNATVNHSLSASVTISSNITNNTFCSGTSVTFTASPTNGGNNPTYQWKVNGVNISGATSSTYTTNTLSNNSTVTVVMGSSIASCLSGSPATSNIITVTVNSVPSTPASITGPTTICLNSNQVYSVSAVAGATSYSWVVTGDLTATSSTSNVLNITAASNAGSGTIKVLASNTCGSSLYSATLSVTVNNTPAPTASITPSTSNLCLSSPSVTFVNSSVANGGSTITAYSWDFGDGSTLVTTANASRTYTASGTYDVVMSVTSSNQCTSSISSRIVVDPISVAGTASAANATICENTSTILTLSGSTGAIQWQSSTNGSTWGNISGATNATYTTANLSLTTYYRAVVTSGACSSATSGVITVTVSPAPTVTLGSVANVYTNATSFDLSYSNPVGGPNEYSITASSPNAMPNFTNINGYGLLGSPITVNMPASAVGTYNFNLVVQNNNYGCNSANIPFTVTVVVLPPSSLSYNTPNVYTVGSTITALNPTSTGGPITQYTIGPSLPAGLTINPTTGVISGTPSAVSSQTTYTVTGTNASGTVTATVVITVNGTPPLSLSYNTPNVYTTGTTISALNPTSTGGAITQYTIGPSLPAGLSINPTTGVISGTPSAVSTQTTYTVTGTNAYGTVTATVVITVNGLPPASLAYNTPNVYTAGTTITALNPTSTGGAITQYTIGPSLPSGLSIDPNTGIISGTPTVASAQTTYTVTGTNAYGSVTATLVITVNSGQVVLPQGGIEAVDYKLFASDTVKIKVNISSGSSPYTVVLSNNNNSTKDTLTNIVNGSIVNLKSVSKNTIYTLFKITDNNSASRTSAFTKDTTAVNIVAPNIALTLKADKAVKQSDNSFKTKLLLKIKNSGEIDLKNVQVNANLSNVFPAGIAYKLDSVKVVSGNIKLNATYQGNGSATSPSSVKKGVIATSGISSNATLDANYLFDNGVSLAINEEADVVFYLSIAPTTQPVVLKLQFSSAGEGVLNKAGGYTSQQSSTAVSDNGANLATHPNNTSIGTPLPTYLPLFPVEFIGAALKVSNTTPVAGGYTFDFVAKARNYSNMNLDTVGIFNSLKKTYPSPDTAYIIGTPVVTGGARFNTNYNGYTDSLLIDSTAKLAVGDSITVSYTLFVGTSKTSGSWANAIFASGHATIDYNYVWDISTEGTNPDPDGNGDPKEQAKTYNYVNFKPPLPPTVENKTYTYGNTIPPTIGGLVKSYPIGTIPVWCDVQTLLCSPTAPSTPTIIGKYYYQLKSYDTTTKLYSIAYVNDTVIIRPPLPIVNDSTYIIGQTNNPANVSVQVKAMTGGVLKYFYKANLVNTIPVLGITPGTTSYTVSQVVNQIESDTASFKVTMLLPNDILHLQKIAGDAQLQSNSSFNIPFTFIARNVLNKQLDSVLITDNLMNAVSLPNTFNIVSLSSTGGLIANTNFNGKTDIYLTQNASKLSASAIDTIKLVINVMPNGYSGALQNTAIANAKTPYGKLSINSTSRAYTANETTKYPTTFTIPDLRIDIPEGFSPNRDGVNDYFVIIKPYGTILDLEVYNRWGNIVYANPNYNNEWDGRGTNNFIGQELMDGGYYYTLKAKSANGTVQIFKGFVLIQR